LFHLGRIQTLIATIATTIITITTTIITIIAAAAAAGAAVLSFPLYTVTVTMLGKLLNKTTGSERPHRCCRIEYSSAYRPHA